MFETLYLGLKGLYFSASASLKEGEESKSTDMAIAVATAMVLATLLFTVIPFFLATFFNPNGVAFNIIEGAVRLSISCIVLGVEGFG